jgi:DNA-binding NarL/FixJ family response regulator
VANQPVVSGVAVVVDNDFVRFGVASILNGANDCRLCAVGRTERDAVEIVERERPHILILDLFPGFRDGILLIKDLVSRYPEMKILALSHHEDLIYAERALRAGAQSFLPTTASVDHLLAAVASLRNGKLYLTRHYSLLLNGAAGPPGLSGRKHVERLTDRELHVFQLIGSGYGPGKIAQELGLSRKTIESYQEKIKEKLGCENAVALKLHAKEWMERAHPEHSLEELAQTGDIP